MNLDDKCVCGATRGLHSMHAPHGLTSTGCDAFCLLRETVTKADSAPVPQQHGLASSLWCCPCGHKFSPPRGYSHIVCPSCKAAHVVARNLGLAAAVAEIDPYAAPAGNGNPKDFIGASKAPLSTVSRRVMHELGLAMLEGECKYWRHNYRAAPVRATVYLDALDRHLSAWIEGQDTDPDSGLSHLVKAMACLAIMRDAQLYGSLIDDRPPAQADPNWMSALNAKAKEIIEANAKHTRGAYTEANRAEWPAMSAALAKGPIPSGR
jgi:hypothetical protein